MNDKTVWAVKRPDLRTGETELFLPYPGAFPVGSSAAAWNVVESNRHLGYEQVECKLVPLTPAEAGDGFCVDCPDHEGCSQGVPCEVAKRVSHG